MNYDGMTENGVEYVSSLYSRSLKYKNVVDDMDLMKPQYDGLMKGTDVSAYSTRTRSLTYSRLSPDLLLKEYRDLRRKKEQLENGAGYRKSVGVIPRDI